MSIVDNLIAAVKATAKTILPGADEALAAGEAIYELAKSIAPTLAEPDQRKLQAALPDLLTAMNRDVDQAIADLGGTGA